MENTSERAPEEDPRIAALSARLLAGEMRLQSMVERSPDPFLILDLDGRVLFANRAAHALYGLAEGELVERPFESVVAPGETSEVRLPGDRVAEVHAAPIDWDGAAARVVVLRDVTERCRSERALRENERRLKMAMDVARLGFWDADMRSGEGVISNERLLGSLGYSPLAVGRSTEDWNELIHPDDLSSVQRAYQTHLDNHVERFSVQFRMRAASGEWRWILSHGEIVERDRQGEPVRMIGVTEDITERKRAEQALLDSERRLALALQAGGSTVWEMDTQTGAVREIEPFATLLGYDGEELKAAGEWIGLIHPDERGDFAADIRRLCDGRRDQLRMELRLRGKAGGWRWVLAQAVAAERDADGQAVRLVGTLTDIGERKRAEEMLRRSEAWFRSMADTAPAMLWVTRRDGGCSFLSRGWYEFTGQKEVEGLGQGWLDAIHPGDREAVVEHSRRAHEQNTPFEHEFRVRRASGGYSWVLAAGRPRYDTDCRFRGFVGSVIDITERKQAEIRVREAALHDPLTGLPNRALVFEYGSLVLAAARRSRGRGAMLFVDLDRFKPINDLYGHETGDRVLQEVARRLQRCTRREDMVGRLGGDEFVILLSHLGSSPGREEVVARHVLDSIAQPFEIGAQRLSLTPSIGISCYPEHSDDIDGLIRTADLAMYEAKQSGRAAYRIYSRELDRKADEALSMEARLRHALRSNGLVLHYQPVIDMESGRLMAAEALVRLLSNGDAVGPDRFIPIAESTGLIDQLGEWVATEACRQQRNWTSEGLRPLTVAMNVSPLQFRHADFADRLGHIVRDAGIDPATLELEVTEGTVMESVEEVVGSLEHIKSMGIQIALDDFGIGYSSLSRLSSLPLDKLKIDQSFVRRMERDQTSLAVTKAIIALGQTLKLKVVGEGIESADVFSHLRDSGCNEAQGFLISRPLPAEEFSSWRRRYAH